MKKLLLGLALWLGLASGAAAQCSGVFPASTVCGNVTGASTTPKAVALSSIPLTSAQFDALFGSTPGLVIYRGASAWVALANGSGALSNNGSGSISWSTAGSGTVTSVSVTAGTGITQSGSPVTTSGAITVNVDKATAANLEAGTSNKVLTSDIIYDSEVTITYASPQTWNFNTFLNARETLTGNITSLTCSNIKASQSGTISLVQDGTGSRTMVAGWCSQFRWTNGSRGVLTTTASAIDALFYTCVTSSICYVSLGKAQAN
jgi:hypothetical protein